jgi:hypothetical protein
MIWRSCFWRKHRSRLVLANKNLEPSYGRMPPSKKFAPKNFTA